jgi:glycine cleavage system H protein
MDGFSYYNIFDTKGIEYLVIIAFLLLLIPFWLALNRKVTINEQFRKALGVLSAAILKVPQGIFYSKNHTWVFLEKSGIAKVGLDNLLLHITGEVKIRQLKNAGESIRKGDLLAVIDQNGKSLNVFSPVSGKVLNSNPVLNENYLVLNADPYGEGWLYSIKPSNWITDISSYYFAEQATEWLKKELERYKDFLAMNLGNYSSPTSYAILQDGGELIDNSLSELPIEMWQDFQKEFLNPEQEMEQ